ncbi:hypothetical protein LCGC14_1811540, partial [marine sediment metagenome]
MAYTIPNEADAFQANQAEPDKVDFDIIAAAHKGDGVVSGCAVSERGAGANMSVDVASGEVRVASTVATVSSGNLVIGAADATDPRFDLVVVNNAGTKAITAGTADANPVFPSIPADSVVLAVVYIPANDTTIETAQITDKGVVAHLATKEYVDSAIHFIEDYFFNNTASSYGGIYYKMLDTPTGEAESTFQSGLLGEGDNQALFNFATDAGLPGVTVLESGVYTGHIHARVTLSNKRPVKIHFKVYFRDNGSETLVTTSEESDFLTNSNGEYGLHATLAADVTIATTDRLIIKWFANVDSTPSSNVIVELFAEGTNASRFSVPIPSAVLNQVFIRQDGTKPFSGEQSMGGNNLTNVGELTLVDGASLNLQEAITFTGATGENKIEIPDALADALSFKESGNAYLTFDSRDGVENVLFSKNVRILSGGYIGTPSNTDIMQFGDALVSLTVDLKIVVDNEKITLGAGSDGELYSSGDDVHLHNVTQDADLVFGINDGGVSKTITWDADVDRLKHSAGTFHFDDDHLTTTGDLMVGNIIVTGTVDGVD